MRPGGALFRRLQDIPSGTLLGRLIRLPLALLPAGRPVTVRAGLNRGMRWLAGAGAHGCWLGHYEAPKQDLLSALVRPGDFAIDVGANAGFFTLALARLAGPGGRVIAIEPLAENVAALRRHVAMNALDNVVVVQAACADAHALAGFQAAATGEEGRLAAGSDYVLPTVTLDEVIALVPGLVPAVVKIDVEGAEAAVLRGARSLLERRQTAFLVATHGPAPERECMDILVDAGYRVQLFDGTPAGGPPGPGSDDWLATPPGFRGA